MGAMVALAFVLIMGNAMFTTITGWQLQAPAACPGDAEFCGGFVWSSVGQWLPTWLFVGHGLVSLALLLPKSIVRI